MSALYPRLDDVRMELTRESHGEVRVRGGEGRGEGGSR